MKIAHCIILKKNVYFIIRFETMLTLSDYHGAKVHCNVWRLQGENVMGMFSIFYRESNFAIRYAVHSSYYQIWVSLFSSKLKDMNR